MRFPFRRPRVWIAAIVVIGGLIAAALLPRKTESPLTSPERRAWRDRAQAEIRARVADMAWLDAQVALLSTHATTRRYSVGWVSDELLVMANGDWIVCRNVAAKETHASIARDLFIGLGSDGKWYYSTFHFCVGKCVLQIEGQPDSLERFVEGYWLKEFDGISDESLTETWNGQPYGDFLLPPATPTP